MAKTASKSAREPVEIARPKRMKLSREESLKRMESFPERKEEFIAQIKGAGKGSGVPESERVVERRADPSHEEVLERMRSFPERMGEIIEAVRKVKDRNLSS